MFFYAWNGIIFAGIEWRFDVDIGLKKDNSGMLSCVDKRGKMRQDAVKEETKEDIVAIQDELTKCFLTNCIKKWKTR